MRERIYYILAIAVLIFAIAALVVVFGQDQPVVSQQDTTQGSTLQSLFSTLTERTNNDAQFSFRIRVSVLADDTVITVSQSATRVVEVGQDYFCLSNDATSRVCYPFSELLAVAIPNG